MLKSIEKQCNLLFCPKISTADNSLHHQKMACVSFSPVKNDIGVGKRGLRFCRGVDVALFVLAFTFLLSNSMADDQFVFVDGGEDGSYYINPHTGAVRYGNVGDVPVAAPVAPPYKTRRTRSPFATTAFQPRINSSPVLIFGR